MHDKFYLLCTTVGHNRHNFIIPEWSLPNTDSHRLTSLYVVYQIPNIAPSLLHFPFIQKSLLSPHPTSAPLSPLKEVPFPTQISPPSLTIYALRRAVRTQIPLSLAGGSGWGHVDNKWKRCKSPWLASMRVCTLLNERRAITA